MAIVYSNFYVDLTHAISCRQESLHIHVTSVFCLCSAVTEEPGVITMPDGAARRMDLDVLYNVMTSIENRVGGGEGIEGIYGTLTQTGCQRVMDTMHELCGLQENSILVDIGAGLGRPLLHALFSPGVRKAYGVEVDTVKCAKAAVFCQQTLLEMAQRQCSSTVRQAPEIVQGNIEEATTLDPCTHAFSFWEGIPVSARLAFGRLFSKSTTLRSVVVIQRSMRKEDPTDVMLDYGFGALTLTSTFPVKMSGRGAQFHAYIFLRTGCRLLEMPVPVGGAGEALGFSGLSDQSSLQPESAEKRAARKAVLVTCSKVTMKTTRPFFS